MLKLADSFLGNDLIQKQIEFLKYGIPAWLLAVIQVGLAFTTLIFAGHESPETLAGVGLGNTMYNVLLWSILWGFTSSFDTFGPQVYSVLEKRSQLGSVALKITLQGILIFIVILGVFLNSKFLVDVVSESNDHDKPGQ